MLIRLNGRNVNYHLMLRAFQNAPSLVIDCANYADPHRFFGIIDEEQLKGVHILNAEAIYRLRDSLARAPETAKKLGAGCICITTIGALFSYDNKKENDEIIRQCDDRIKELAERYKVYIACGVKNGTHNSKPEDCHR